jgi:hypothetical protein
MEWSQFLHRQLPASPAYSVIYFAADLVCWSLFVIRSVLIRGSLLTNKLMSQGFQLARLHAAFRKFYGRYNDLVCPYNLSLGHMLSDVFHTNR